MDALMADTFKPGDKVPRSGIYRVVHHQYHAQEHEVICVRGEPFPPCNHCDHHVRFVQVRTAQHIDSNDNFS